MSHTLQNQSIFGSLITSDDVVSKVSRFADAGQVDPVRTGRKLMGAAGIMLAALAVLVAACVTIWTFDDPSAEGQMVLALTVGIALVVLVAAGVTFLANALQALIFQHIALSESSIELMEAEQERSEVERDLREVKETLESVRNERSTSRLREAIEHALDALCGRDGASDGPSRPLYTSMTH